MNERPSALDLTIDVATALPMVGDKKRVHGSADLVLRDGYDMEFQQGDGLSWTLDLRRIAGALEVAGDVEGHVALNCYRCLEDFDFAVSIIVREHALWLNAAAGEQDTSADEYEVEDGVVDLEPILRDAIALAFPASRLCSEECKGLCTRCGANMNLEPCACPAKPVDSRLKGLADLKERLLET